MGYRPTKRMHYLVMILITCILMIWGLIELTDFLNGTPSHVKIYFNDSTNITTTIIETTEVRFHTKYLTN